MNKGSKHLRGISLVELLLVLALAAVLAFLGIRSLNQSRTEANILALQENVARLFQAMNEYYAEKCVASMGANFNITWNDIAPIELLPTNLVAAANNPYEIKATFYQYNENEAGVKIPMYRFLVTVKLASRLSQSYPWYAERLQAQLVGDSLVWMKAPSYSIKHRGTQTWPMASQLKRFKQEYAGDDLSKLSCGY